MVEVLGRLVGYFIVKLFKFSFNCLRQLASNRTCVLRDERIKAIGDQKERVIEDLNVILRFGGTEEKQ